MELKYKDVLKALPDLRKNITDKKYYVKILSNITLTLLGEAVEYALRTGGINAHISTGNFDNIVQESANVKDCDCVIVFCELANLVDGLYYRAETLETQEIDSLITKTKTDMDFIFNNLKEIPLVLFNAFSSLPFVLSATVESKYETIGRKLNEHIFQNTAKNVKIIDINKIIAALSVENSIDYRFFYSSRALYTFEFHRLYACAIAPVIMSVTGKAKKVLVLDCDNTLWKGTVGEDGLKKIEMSPNTTEGLIFTEVQHIALSLMKKGVLLCVCSKNNPDDVDEILQTHPDMILRSEHFAIKKINWTDKVTNLKDIASELNVSAESIVYVDDSQFEIGLVNQFLPEIKTVLVPENIYEYPQVMRKISELFYISGHSKEDERRTKLYSDQKMRNEEKLKYDKIEDYLKSLGLKLNITVNEKTLIPRMSQLTQKTNQFNLTTKRYTDAEIEKFINTGHLLFCFSACDRFGDYGFTGLSIISPGDTARIDTFLMSCRVIGRDLEFVFFNEIVHNLRKHNVRETEAQYVRTGKNDQVSTFYDSLHFIKTSEDANVKNYRLNLKDFEDIQIDYIEVGSDG
ncbi:MAG: HAD-IIIC family phosphatase [Nitrospirae bacterium]|nr:HAD-IIIC family phosphatase [Nitrospirota bacterium]MBF0536441.1 HAD-IIIC family phosphatase [Nitrospirota bacterium]MBF0618348.1 HAD-IIIC family phosphatase [Nitrospirota bacterium]